MTLRRVYHTFYVVQGENSARSCARGDNLRSVVLFTKRSFPALSFLLMNDKAGTVEGFTLEIAWDQAPW